LRLKILKKLRTANLISEFTGSCKKRVTIFNFLARAYTSSGVATGGGASGGTRPGAQALGAHQHSFCSPLKTRFKHKFRSNYA